MQSRDGLCALPISGLRVAPFDENGRSSLPSALEVPESESGAELTVVQRESLSTWGAQAMALH